MNKCEWHLCNKSLSGKQERFCSPECKNKFYVALRRKELKRRAVAYKGGKCVICGYDKALEALSFHHGDRKEFGISAKGYTRSWDKVNAELEECILVCANCHAEIHAGLHDIAALFGNE
jgi:predicted HNH restriction endonuclease